MIVVALPKVPKVRNLSLRLIYSGAICFKIPSKTFGNVTVIGDIEEHIFNCNLL
jgi:hypothetical protein